MNTKELLLTWTTERIILDNNGFCTNSAALKNDLMVRYGISKARAVRLVALSARARRKRLEDEK